LLVAQSDLLSADQSQCANCLCGGRQMQNLLLQMLEIDSELGFVDVERKLQRFLKGLLLDR
jgi:hypothetical protein